MDYSKLNFTQRREGAKSMLIVLCSLLIVLCSLLVGCSEQLATKPRSEMGSFTLQLGDSAARTIMPSTPAMTEFAVFRLIFVAAATPNGADPRTVDIDNPNFGDAGPVPSVALDPVILVAGNYILTIQAYKTAGTAGPPPVDPTGLAAQSAEVPITITAGANVTQTVVLNTLLGEPGGNGKFIYDVEVLTVDHTITVATMTINASGVTQGEVVNLLTPGAGKGERELPAGIYTVDFSLTGYEGTDTTDQTKKSAIVWSELLYVYSTLESRFPATVGDTHQFTDDHFFRTHWKVELTFDNRSANELQIIEGGEPLGKDTQSVWHGEKLDITPPTRKGFLFGGWFHNTAGTGDAWNLDNPVHQDLDLFAKWTPNTATLTLEIADIVNLTPDYTTPITISTASDATPLTTPPSEFTVTVTAVTDATYKWEIKSVSSFYPDVTQDVGTTFTLSAANNSYNTIGGHVLKLTVTVGGREYVKNIPFTVTK